MWDILLIGARLLQFAGALVLLGSALFCLYGMKPVAPPLPTTPRLRWTQRVLVVSAIAAAAGTVLWVMSETVLFSGDPADGTNLTAVWVVFSETRFGQVCLWRIGLLLVSLAVSAFLTRKKALLSVQAVLAGVVVGTFAWTGHGAMTAGWPGVLHLGGDLLHLWVAGVWFGALVPLAILIAQAHRSGSREDAVVAQFGLNRFTDIGTAVVAALVISGLVNTWFLMGAPSWQGVFHTAYGLMLLTKVGFFSLMLVLAGANRFWLTPRLWSGLTGGSAGSLVAMRALRISVLAETGLAVLVLLAVAVLGTLEPPNAGG